MYELDLLVATMLLLTLWHATSNGTHQLALAALCLGILIETLSQRLGGTHCHAPGLVNVSVCSSANSILYYVPWVYSCVMCAGRLTESNSWTFPFVCGLLFFGMCGVYECQGPMMGWWLWPQADKVVKGGVSMWRLGQHGSDERGLVVSDHAFEALSVRVFGVPALAPYFHFAFGWGIAVAFQARVRWDLPFGSMLPVLCGPTLGLFWELPVRVLEALLGANKLAITMAVMACAVSVTFFAGAALKHSPRFDPLLFASPLVNGAFFFLHALIGRGASILPGELKLFVLCVASCATIAFARACGLFTPVGTKLDLREERFMC